MKVLKIILFAGCLCLALSGCSRFCEHTYQSAVTREATCALEGEETFTCSRCRDRYTKPIPSPEHTLDQGTVGQEPTCSVQGVMKHSCLACGAAVERPMETLPHTPGEFTVTKEPNCTEKGERTATCTVCAATVTEQLRTNGVHQMVNQVIREATCVDPGEGVDVCALCNQKRACGYPLKPHSYSGTTCGSAGTCTVCGAKGSAAGHSYVITSDVKPSGNYAGRKERVCSACGVKGTVYYTNNYTYDLDGIYNELVDYARQKGFKITTTYPTPSGRSDYKSSYSQDTVFLDVPGEGPARLLLYGKIAIDDAYKFCSGRTNLYTAYIYVNYGQSGATGSGSFSAGILINS